PSTSTSSPVLSSSPTRRSSDLPQLLLDRPLGRPRARRLAPHVEYVRAFLEQTHRMGERGGGRVVRAAIGKRIRGDVGDAHCPGAVEHQWAAIAVKGRGSVEHAHERKGPERTLAPSGLRGKHCQVWATGPTTVPDGGGSSTGGVSPLLQSRGGPGVRPFMMSSIWLASMVSYCSSASAITCSLSRLSFRIAVVRW